MVMLHDATVRARLEARLRALTPAAKPRWGKMSVDQMLWHVSDAMAVAIGELEIAPRKPPLPARLVKFMAIKMPWPKGAPTHPAFVATRTHDFEKELARALRLVAALAAKPLAGPWPNSPVFGPMTGEETSLLHAKHVDHHLKQFGA